MENEVESKCPNCGSHLKYDPKKGKLECESCASLFDIESLGSGKLDEEELDYNRIINELKNTKLTKESVSSFNCTNCGASLMNNGNITSVVCPFCASSHILEINKEEEIIPIAGIIPFRMNKEDCDLNFHKWIKGKFFAPNRFKNSKFRLDLYPIYLPFWTFDMECYTEYSAKRGDYYYVVETHVDHNGNKYTERKRKTRWTHTSGHCHNSFDDIVVLGSNSDNRQYIRRICNFNFKEMEKFNPKFLVGYHGEKISLPLEEGFKQARQSVDWDIKVSIERDVGGDEVRIDHYETKYSDVTFKQILAPIYNGIYNYNGKQYSFVINGQNSKFSGEYPVSGLKVFFFVLFIIGVVLAIILLITQNA